MSVNDLSSDSSALKSLSNKFWTLRGGSKDGFLAKFLLSWPILKTLNYPHKGHGYTSAVAYYQFGEGSANVFLRRNNRSGKLTDNDTSFVREIRYDNLGSPDTSGRLTGKECRRFTQKISFPPHTSQPSLVLGNLLIPWISCAAKSQLSAGICFTPPPRKQTGAMPSSYAIWV